MDGLLDPKAQFLAIARTREGIEVDIDEGEEMILFVIVGDDDRDDLDYDHAEEEEKQIVLMLKELEDPSPCPTGVNLMRVDQPQAPEQINEIEASIKGIEKGPIDVFEISPVLGEVIVGVSQGIDDQLYCNDDGHEYAKNRGAFLHGIVILEDEPLRSDSDREGDDDEHEGDAEVDLGLDGRGQFEVFAATEEGIAVLAHHL